MRRSARLLKRRLRGQPRQGRRGSPLCIVGGILLPILWTGTGSPMVPQVGAVAVTIAFLGRGGGRAGRSRFALFRRRRPSEDAWGALVVNAIKAPRLLDRLRSLARAKDGHLTRELLRRPGRFGLGQVPARVAPESTTWTTCGYCSTGCGLDIHMKDGQAVNLTPAADATVNRGMACPKGWEALTVLDAPDRATTPLLRDADGQLRPVDWHAAMETMAARIKA